MKTKTMKREMWSTIAELKSDAPYICEERHDLYRRGDSISVTLTWEEPKPETAEDLLRELVKDINLGFKIPFNDVRNSLSKARAFLGKAEGK